MNVVEQILKNLGPGPGDLDYRLSRNTFEYIFAEDRRQGLSFHDIWVCDTDKALAEITQQAWMLSIRQTNGLVTDAHIQVLAYSAHALTKYVLDPLLEAIK